MVLNDALFSWVDLQPLADAVYYKNQDIIKLLEKHGAVPTVAPMHVQNPREVPEYEIDPKELDFTESVNITKVIPQRVKHPGAT